MSWYRSYRPQKIVDLEIASVRDHFLNVLKTGEYAHAYLFTGPRGTGKTSTARILARVLNDPANEAVVLAKKGTLQEPDLDNPLLQRIAKGRAQGVIEQDAASHRGIDDIRQLQEEVSVVSPEGTVRVVILDEVHMLTAEAFNALLKLLEEPPERVVFILATTELHKVPATIQSRCQVIQFRLASRNEIKNALQKVIEGEKLTIAPQALESLITAANGSFRDAVKWLQQATVNGSVSAEAVASLVGGTQEVQNLLMALAKKDVGTLEKTFSQMRQSGTSFASVEVLVLQSLHERLTRALDRGEGAVTVQNILGLLEFFVARAGSGPEPVDGLRFEVSCYRWVLGPNTSEDVESGGGSGSPKDQTIPTKNPTVVKQKTSPSIQACAMQPVAEKIQPLAGPKAQTMEISERMVQEQWESILLALRTRSTAVEALLRTSELGSVTEKSVEIRVARPFHQERLEEPKYRLLLQEVLAQQLGQEMQLVITLLPQNPNEFQPVDNSPDDFASVVENIISQAHL